MNINYNISNRFTFRANCVGKIVVSKQQDKWFAINEWVHQYQNRKYKLPPIPNYKNEYEKDIENARKYNIKRRQERDLKRDQDICIIS